MLIIYLYLNLKHFVGRHLKSEEQLNNIDRIKVEMRLKKTSRKTIGQDARTRFIFLYRVCNSFCLEIKIIF